MIKIYNFEICPCCNSTDGYVFVHSHYQCLRCHQNIHPCCGGEQETEEMVQVFTEQINAVYAMS